MGIGPTVILAKFKLTAICVHSDIQKTFLKNVLPLFYPASIFLSNIHRSRKQLFIGKERIENRLGYRFV